MGIDISKLGLSGDALKAVQALVKANEELAAKNADLAAKSAATVREVFTSTRGFVCVRFGGSGRFPTMSITANRLGALLDYAATADGRKTLDACAVRAMADEANYKPDREPKAPKDSATQPATAQPSQEDIEKAQLEALKKKYAVS